MNLQRMLELTEELVRAPGPSGQEDAVREVALRELKDLCAESWVDEGGNAIGLLRGESRGTDEAIRVMAHLDELSMIVKRIEPDGRLRVRPLGGLTPAVFGMGPVEILGSARTLPGVLSVGPLHVSDETPHAQDLKSPEKGGKNKGIVWTDVHVFTRLPVEELEAAGVRPGTRVVIHASRRGLLEIGDCVAGYFLDDRVCVAIMLAAASLMKQRKTRPPRDVYLVATCQEETGGGVAAYAAAKLPAGTVLAVDIGPAAKEYTTELTAAPIVVYKDNRSLYHKGLADRLFALGNELDLEPQAAVWENYASDASFAKSVGLAPKAGLLCIPTDNTHGYEIVVKQGIENCAKLLAAYLEAPE